MKYTTEVTIDLPRSKVIELFDSVENMYQWQEGLKSFKHLERFKAFCEQQEKS